MKTTVLIIACLLAAACAAPAQDLVVEWVDGSSDAYAVAAIDSITFQEGAAPAAANILSIHADGGVVRFAVPALAGLVFTDGGQLQVTDAAGVVQTFALADVDSLTLADAAATPVTVTYAGAAATVVNPLADVGVAVTVDGADVTVTGTNGLAGVVFALSGASSDGLFKAYADADFDLVLNGLTLTNVDGPAINIQADETIGVTLADGTTSTLTDGVTYAAAPNDEDQKACFFSEGQLVFGGEGTLIIHGQGDDQHGLGSDDYVAVNSGTIQVLSAVKDGIHTNEGYYQLGGDVSVASGSDGVDAGDGPVEISGGALSVALTAQDKDAVKCDGILLISGGAVDLDVSGDQSKGLNAVEVHLAGGDVTIVTSGDAVLEASGSGFDPSYCTAIKADALVLLDGAAVDIVTTGLAGRGVSCDGDVTVLSGSLQVTSSGNGAAYTNELGQADAYHGPCIKADLTTTLTGGSITLTHTGSAGKGLSGDGDLLVNGSGLLLQVAVSGASVTYGFSDAAEAKAVSMDGAVSILDGTLILDATDDALKSKTSIVVDGGVIEVTDCEEGLEAPFLTINGGEIHVHAADDALNATMGSDIEGDDGSELVINGGYVALDAPSGDAIDSNGTLTIAGGTVLVHGASSQPEVGIDVNGTFRTDGGFIVVAQINSNMVETPSSLSGQRAVLLRSSTTFNAGTLFHLEDTAGNELVTFRPNQRYSSVLISAPGLASGTSYRVYTSGTHSGTPEDGLYTGGAYTPGTLRTTFASSGTVQTVQF